MSNHSAEAPDGVLPANVLKSFFSVRGLSGNLTYQRGYEVSQTSCKTSDTQLTMHLLQRIPDNWYRRAIGNDYGIVQFQLDVLRVAAKVPGILKVGGNVSTSFRTGILADYMRPGYRRAR